MYNCLVSLKLSIRGENNKKLCIIRVETGVANSNKLSEIVGLLLD